MNDTVTADAVPSNRLPLSDQPEQLFIARRPYGFKVTTQNDSGILKSYRISNLDAPELRSDLESLVVIPWTFEP